RLGKSRSSIANFLRLMNYPEEIRKAVEKNEISEGHARAIMGIEDEKIRLAIFRRILREHLSVHEVEEIAKAGKKEKGGRAQVHKKKDIFIQDIENKIRRKLGTKIEVVNKKKGKNITGRIIIHYFSEEELNRILALLK
ncbi:MAG TPA: chromosome partitioning protein ParB, partial [bacterium]|nr:chromosome partitioning protein ParB [bacterium]